MESDGTPLTSEHPDGGPRPATVVVIPCYNEAERLDVDAFVDFVDERPWLSLIFVDDGSVDATAEVIETARQRAPAKIRCVTLEHNSGKAEAVRCGVLRALDEAPELVGFWDADLATPLAEIDRFRAVFEPDAEPQIVIGSRVKMPGAHIERSEIRHYFGRVAATTVSWILGVSIYDTQCGAKLFRVGPDTGLLFEEPFTSRWAFDVEILARWLIGRPEGGDVHRAIIELPVRQWIDVPGSKLRTMDFVCAPLDLWRIRRRYARGLRERARRGGESR